MRAYLVLAEKKIEIKFHEFCDGCFVSIQSQDISQGVKGIRCHVKIR